MMLVCRIIYPVTLALVCVSASPLLQFNPINEASLSSINSPTDEDEGLNPFNGNPILTDGPEVPHRSIHVQGPGSESEDLLEPISSLKPAYISEEETTVPIDDTREKESTEETTLGVTSRPADIYLPTDDKKQPGLSTLEPGSSAETDETSSPIPSVEDDENKKKPPTQSTPSTTAPSSERPPNGKTSDVPKPPVEPPHLGTTRTTVSTTPPTISTTISTSTPKKFPTTSSTTTTTTPPTTTTTPPTTTTTPPTTTTTPPTTTTTPPTTTTTPPTTTTTSTKKPTTTPTTPTTSTITPPTTTTTSTNKPTTSTTTPTTSTTTPPTTTTTPPTTTTTPPTTTTTPPTTTTTPPITTTTPPTTTTTPPTTTTTSTPTPTTPSTFSTTTPSTPPTTPTTMPTTTLKKSTTTTTKLTTPTPSAYSSTSVSTSSVGPKLNLSTSPSRVSSTSTPAATTETPFTQPSVTGGRSTDSTSPATELPAYFIVSINMKWSTFCEMSNKFKRMLKILLIETIEAEVQLFDTQCPTLIGKRRKRNVVIKAETDLYLADEKEVLESGRIDVKVAIADGSGRVNPALTRRVFKLIESEEKRQDLSEDVFIQAIQDVAYGPDIEQATQAPNVIEDGKVLNNPIIGAISAVMLVCIIGLVIISVVIFKRHKSQQRRRFMRPSIHHDDNYSLSSLSVTTGEFSTAKRHGNKSFRSTLKTNPGFTTDELSYTNTMTLSKLSTRSLEMDYLEEELKSIPSNMPKMCSLPEGAQAKNRYANVIPLESSRVILTSKPRTGNSQYINANYIKGYNGSPKAYIATQAPLQHTVVDFWTMVWENQSQVIVMLMNWVEDNQYRCAQYLPQSDGVDSISVHGDYEIFLKKKLIRDQYIFSCLVIKNMELNLCRDVVHFQYLDFPSKGTPSSVCNFLTFIKDARPYMEISHGPTVVHCSTGTGRTGTFLAIERCLQTYDDSYTVDVMNCVYRLRQDRAGAVHTTAHYAFIYKTMLEYANMTGGSNSPSKWSSRSSVSV